MYNSLQQINLSKSTILHTDRGTEFANEKVKLLLDKNNVKHSLSKTGCPYNNAVSENLFGIFKCEWVKDKYDNINELNSDVDSFVHNYNNFRLPSKLGYKSPVEYRLNS